MNNELAFSILVFGAIYIFLHKFKYKNTFDRISTYRQVYAKVMASSLGELNWITQQYY